MTTPDSPLAATFVAAPDHWPRNGAPIKAIACHMAEGGGTVQWLTHDDGNSSTYVCEFSGRIVQMVAESLAAGSLNPSLTRTTNDAAYTFEGERVVYGITVLRNALGAGALDPNRAVIAIETEGFARPLTAAQRLRFPKANPAGGPNAAQRAALKALVNDIRRRNGALPAIGHRDQQSYKACPGHAFPWADYGGHGVKAAYVAPIPPDTSTGEDTMTNIEAKIEQWKLDGTSLVTTLGAPRRADGTADYGSRFMLQKTGTGWDLVSVPRNRLTFVDGSLTDPGFAALSTYAIATPDAVTCKPFSDAATAAAEKIAAAAVEAAKRSGARAERERIAEAEAVRIRSI